MSSNEPLNETILFDPDQLQALAQQLRTLQKTNPSATVDTLLAGHDPTTQSLYREPLLRLVSAHSELTPDNDSALERATLGETLLVDTNDSGSILESTGAVLDAEASTDPAGAKRADATLDVPIDIAANVALDLPPAARPQRSPSKHAHRDRSDSIHELPEKIGKFEIKGELGRGAFGVVYLGYDRDLQRNVAIKLSLVADKKLQDKLRIEASKVAQVESDGIVPVYHIGNTESGATYIVQKYIQGSTLRELLTERGPLSPAGGIRLIRDIALGLEPAHLHDILHRDLKPDNILVDEQGKPWIADFGLAISEEEQLGRKGELAGTPAYMSPEQIKGRIDFLDPRSDIWSLGVMYYELLCGKLPFNGRDRRALAEQICELDPRPLHQRSPNLTEDVDAVFRGCCAKKPADRFASARELAVALDRLIAGGLSDQMYRSSGAANLYGDSTLLPASTHLHSGSHAGSTQRSSQLDPSHDHSDLQTPSQLETSQHPSSTHLSSRDSISSSHTISGSHRSQLSTESSVHTASSSGTPWWLRMIGQLVSLCVMVAVSVFVTKYLLLSTSPHPTAHPDPSTDTTGAMNAGQSPIAGTSSTSSLPVEVPVANGAGTVLATAAEGAPADDLPQQPAAPMLDVDGSEDKPWVVDAHGNGSHLTIQAAIDEAIDTGSKSNAPGGPYIIVMPGAYDEQLQITQPISIRGQSDLGECVIKNAQGPPLRIQCEQDGTVVIRDLMIDAQGHSSAVSFNAINLESGSLDIESCTIRTTSQNCIKAFEETSVTATDCQFTESRHFAISTRNHRNLIVKNCFFRLSGVQLVGGPGQISSSKFHGQEGILSDRSLPGMVEVSDCLFSECIEYGTAATNNSTMKVTGCTYQDCKIGAWATFTDENQATDHPSESPGTITVANSTFNNCTSALRTENALLQVREHCAITGGIMAIGVNGGVFEIEDGTVSEAASTGITVLQKGVAKITNTSLVGCGQNGIVINSGSLVMTGGSISNSGDVAVFLDRDCESATFNGVTFKDNQFSTVTSLAENALVTLARSRFSNSDFGVQVTAKTTLTRVGIDSCFFSDLRKQAIYASGTVHVKHKNCDFAALPEEKQVVKRQAAIVEKM